MNFQKWKDEVDLLLLETLGLVTEDLPHYPFATYFKEAKTPQEVLNLVKPKLAG